VTPPKRGISKLKCEESAQSTKEFGLFWSHPPGSNRRPADYETIQSLQLAEKSIHRLAVAPAIEAVVALVEQVSEQVGALLPFPMITAAEVEQVRRRRASEGIQLKGHCGSVGLFDPASGTSR
jgi:hypothetical protein